VVKSAIMISYIITAAARVAILGMTRNTSHGYWRSVALTGQGRGLSLDLPSTGANFKLVSGMSEKVS
jgi:hypothetical protein